MMNDARDDREMTAAPGTSRRRLLRAATGGFALAASGLFLPEWLEETEARDGALGGAKGGRHGQDHKGQHRHRSHGDKKDQGNDKDNRPPGAGAPGGSPIRYVAIRAEGYAQTNVRFYFRTIDGLGRFSPLKLGDFGQIPGLRSNLDYAPKMYSAAVYYYSSFLPSPVLFEVQNPLISIVPWAKVTWGCDIDGQGNVVGGSTYLRDGESEVPMVGHIPINFQTFSGGQNEDNPQIMENIYVARIDKSDTHYWFGTRVVAD